MAKILFIRSLPLERDSRSIKMVSEYRKRGHRVKCLVWSRGDTPTTNADTVTCTVRGGYGQRLRGLGARLAWMWFMARHMIRNRRDYEVVHVVDLDTGIVGVPLARLFRKIVIYDAFDHVGAIVGGGAVGVFLASAERWTIGRAAIAIFPDPVRLQQYGVTSAEKVCIISNIPDTRNIVVDATAHANQGPLQLVYIGTLEAKHRGLEYLPAICAEYIDAIEFVVGGAGELHDYFLDAAKQNRNLTYIGHQEYEAALRLMASADCLYGPYLLSAPAHRYASPNKMYEHLALGKPLITSAGTPPADLVSRLGSGFLFDGTLVGLHTLLADLDRNSCCKTGQRAAAAWRAEFATLRGEQINYFFDRFDCLAVTMVRP